MSRILNFFLFVGAIISAQSHWVQAQVTFPVNGVVDQREGLYAFTNATIYVAWNERTENATLLIRDGKVEALGAKVAVPADAVVIDLKGKTVYPSFIDIYSDYGMPTQRQDAPSGGRMFGMGAQRTSSKKGPFSWNEALKPEFRAHEVFSPDEKSAKALRDLGFGAVLSHQTDGISRGSSTVVTLSDLSPHELIVKDKAAHHFSFSKGSSRQDYPGSLMGSVALLRQTWYDAQWYKNTNEEYNVSLQAWNDLASLPQIFEVGNRTEGLRAAAIGNEFGIQFIIKGAGDDYQRIEDLRKTGSSLILPLNFPDAYDVEDPLDARRISLSQLKHWEMAPSNPARVAAAGIPFAITSHGLRNKADFMNQLRKAIEYGLSEADALKALTHTPATMLGVAAQLGSLAPGKIANFFVTNGNIFTKDAKIYQHWVNGKPYVLKDLDAPNWTGKYKLDINGAENQSFNMTVSGTDEAPEFKIATSDTSSVKVRHAYQKGLLTLTFALKDGDNRVRLTGSANGRNWSGTGEDENGRSLSWSATYQAEPEAGKGASKAGKPAAKPEIGEVNYPFGAYGWTSVPKAGTWLITNATVWTNENDGVLSNADVLLRDGKIVQVGKGLKASDAQVVDGTGKHLTPGIIDEHSHIAISRGVNEGSQASTAEVRIGDVVNPDDVNIYRQLSGGVTAAQLLHGSANPIGGQSAIIKLRWGFSPNQMIFDAAPGFIKFALGENVKQSGWTGSDRYPQTRMGVEEVYDDFFTRAREYGAQVASGKPFRRDLDLEALLEILQGKRFITCHSYRQSEINMLMKVAERHQIKINTFTHILEGYKVADKMAAHGAGGSSFSDWWAYKYEVYDAIPQNGAIMHEQGVTVAFNSDDAEMARRLNQEAAKAVLFGGVAEEDALKFVTLNPAKLLHIDHRVGSIKAGKDADVVLWNAHPLSVYARAEMTFVDGMRLFDRQEDLRLRTEMQTERNRIIQKMLKEKQQGSRTQPVMGRQSFKLYHCDDEEEE